MLMSLNVVSLLQGSTSEDTPPKGSGLPAQPQAPPTTSCTQQEWHWGPGQGRGRDDLRMLDLLLGLGQVQLSPRERAVQAALLCIQPQRVLMASKLLPLHLGRNTERLTGGS